MLEFRTTGYHGFSVKYSPYIDNRIAVAASANYGLVGNGRLFVLNLTAQGIVAEKWYDTKDTLYDTCWSECHDNQVAVASGDGSVRLFDLAHDTFPIAMYKEHAREVFSVHWNYVNTSSLASSSWDGTIKIYDLARSTSIVTIPTGSCTYSVQFSPHDPMLVSCSTGGGACLVYDLRLGEGARQKPIMQFMSHHIHELSGGTAAIGADMALKNNAAAGQVAMAEVLTHDWNKYRSQVMATGSVDNLVRTFDFRNPRDPLVVLKGHEYTVRKVSWSPHVSDVLLSASYDMSCRIWTDGSAAGMLDGRPPDPMAHGAERETGRMTRHSEFAMGIDWCLFGSEGWCASTGWDERVLVWDVRAFTNR